MSTPFTFYMSWVFLTIGNNFLDILVLWYEQVTLLDLKDSKMHPEMNNEILGDPCQIKAIQGPSRVR